MSVNYGTSIATSGLAFYYDMSNTQKSWRGAPTTNYIPNPYASWNGSSFVLGYNYQNLGATYTYRTGVENPVNAPGVLEYYTGTSGYKYFSIDSTSLPSTGNYTFSYYARLTGAPAGGNNAPIDSQLWRANGSDRSVTGDWNPTFTTEWKRYSTTGPAEASTILQYFPVHSGNIIGGYTIQYCGFQLEVGSYATPLAIGTRSTTQALVDLTGRNTLTASSLTYESGGTFSFNGSSNYINLDNNIQAGYTSASYEFWCRPSALPGSGNYFQLYIQESSTWIALYNLGAGAFFGIDLNNGAGWFDNNGGSNTGARTTATLTANTYYHVAYSWNGSAVSVYLNGNLQATVSTLQAVNGRQNVTQLGAGGTPRNIGSRGNGTANNWIGTIDNARFYNRALSAVEVQQNFNALRGRYGL